MSDVHDPGRYDAAVLGSAIHCGKWLPPAKQFMDLNSASLREHPVWLFSVSMLGDEENMFQPRVTKRLRGLRKGPPEIVSFRPAVNPREHRNFAEAIARSHWPASGRAFFRAMVAATAITGTGRRSRRGLAASLCNCFQPQTRQTSSRWADDGDAERLWQLAPLHAATRSGVSQLFIPAGAASMCFFRQGSRFSGCYLRPRA
jgi:hypothetical protein